MPCLKTCMGPAEVCLERCKCGSEIVRITEGKPINTAALVESVYGNVHDLSAADLKTIDWSLSQKALIESLHY